MISHITGTILKKQEGAVLIDVSGIGYMVHCSQDTFSSLPKEGEVVSLWTYLAVRENALDLYGFTERTEQELFELLIEVPGIGPKSGLAILSLATVPTLRKSIISGDTTYLTKVSGIGKKSAEKIVLELKDKLGRTTDDGPDLTAETDTLEALQSLGYSLKESREVLKNIPDTITDTSERVRAALKVLGKK